MTTTWNQLSVKIPSVAHDTVANYFIEKGSPGVVLNRNQVQAYFPISIPVLPLEKDIQRFFRGINDIYPGIGNGALRWKVLKQRDWQNSWRRYFPEIKIGKGILIKPPWLKAQRVGRREVITIEPGMAFGTGAHPTTRSCLEYLEEVVTSFKGRKLRALDVGTGSGILAIALAKLGVNRIVGLDLDPIAVQVARKNLIRNGVEKIVKLEKMEIGRARGYFDVVVANLTVETIIELAPEFWSKTSKKGHLILSGILETQKDKVIACFIPMSFALLQQKRSQDWVTLLLQKRL